MEHAEREPEREHSLQRRALRVSRLLRPERRTEHVEQRARRAHLPRAWFLRGE